MKGVQAACPACGGPVKFRISSALVTVCEFCRTVVARTDRTIEDLGKVAALVETASPLHIGLKGTYNGKRFRIVGRVQHQHAAGGVWDEWYAAFPGGKWGWLAEAQGRFSMSFEKEIPVTLPLPELGELHAGQRIRIADQDLTVAEVGEATAAGAEGEMPFVLHPGERHRYADLQGAQGRFVTLDFENPRPTVFIGKEATLDELGIDESVRAPEAEARRISGLQVNCPQCGGALALAAPDQTQRVVCLHCSAMLDCSQGKLAYLETLNIGRAEFVLEIGQTGKLNDVEYMVIGAMQRSVTYDGTDYYWTEYLLYQPRVGFRWLVESDDHWSFVEPVSAGEIVEGTRQATVGGRDFKLFQQATATVRYVIGEFYWKVSIGETVFSRDFIAPPQMLSIEHSSTVSERPAKKKRRPPSPPPVESDTYGLAREEPADLEFGDDAEQPVVTAETNYSLGTYLPHEEVEKAFGVVALSRGWKVAPNQPKPVDGRVFLWWAGFVAAIFLFYLLGSAIGPGADGWLGIWAAVFVSVIPIGALVYRHSFEVSRWKDSEYSPYPSGSDSEDE